MTFKLRVTALIAFCAVTGVSAAYIVNDCLPIKHTLTHRIHHVRRVVHHSRHIIVKHRVFHVMRHKKEFECPAPKPHWHLTTPFESISVDDPPPILQLIEDQTPIPNAQKPSKPPVDQTPAPFVFDWYYFWWFPIGGPPSITISHPSKPISPTPPNKVPVPKGGTGSYFPPPPPPRAAPEFDPGSMGSAITLLLGSIGLISSYRKRRCQKS